MPTNTSDSPIKLPECEVLSTPTKSPHDKKEFRLIRLPNGLKALLISDLYRKTANSDEDEDETDDGEENDDGDEEESGSDDDNDDELEEKEGDDDDDDDCKKIKQADSTKYLAAASLSVGVGSFEDPDEIPGLMHFLEHMVFMGSKKYPMENAFDMFIKKHGGVDDAHTDMEHTSFYFEVQEKYFSSALDHFAQFFIDPLMLEESMKREREAVHSEFQMALPNDGVREQQLFASMADPKHPMSKFTWGNETTLNVEIPATELHKKLHQLRLKYYSAHYMTLAVQSRESLDTLQEFVVNTFSEVPCNGIPRPSYMDYGFPFPEATFHRLYRVVPMKDYHSVGVTWALPSLHSQYRTKPLAYVGHLLGHEGRGSLLSFLKKKVWATDLCAGNEESGFEHNTTYASLNIDIRLTDEGFNSVREVLLAVFQYLHMIVTTGPVETIFKEIKKIEQLNFDYAEESSPIDNVENLSENMLLYNDEDVLNGDCLLYDYKPELITKCFEYLSPHKCNIIICSKQYETKEICDKTEKWFGTKYAIEDIPKEWIEEWINPGANSDFHLPHPNTFIPANFALLPIDCDGPEYPQKIFHNEWAELWYKADHKFKLPRAYCYVHLILDSVPKFARSQAMLDLFLNIFQNHIMEDIYPAQMAQYCHRVVPSERGLVIKINGFDDKLPECLDMLLHHLETFAQNLDEETFNQIKREQMKRYHNIILKPMDVVRTVRLSILQNHYWRPDEKLHAIKDVTSKDLLQEFVSELFPKCHIRMLVQGNVKSEDALRMFHLVFSRKKKTLPSTVTHFPQIQTMELLRGDWATCLNTFNPADINSCIVNYYQADPGTMQTEVMNEFLMMVLDEPIFDSLRTKEQLGYHVGCVIHNTFGILGLSVLVNTQADKFSCNHVDKRIEEFLFNFQTHLKDVSDDDLLTMQETLRSMKQTIDLTLREEVQRNWAEIVEEEYVFDRLEQQIKLIPNITRDAVLQWFKDLVVEKDNKKYRKLSIQVIGNKTPNPDAVPTLETSSTTENLFTFCVGDIVEGEDLKRSKEKFILSPRDYKKQLTMYPITKIR